MDVNDAARARFIDLECSPEDADLLVHAGIDPDIVGTNAPDAVSFASAAVHHDLADPNGCLEAAGGDPDEAWRAWARDSIESPMYEGDDEGDDRGPRPRLRFTGGRGVVGVGEGNTPYDEAGRFGERRTRRVISLGAKTRNGGPQKPVPRLV
ncbi:hypothetical protein [Streptomyces sp. L2]|uniref:hypothetical protein n=1 Tax=Streptomyces sp. L2 TaxID=2162665 RepID=UPI0019D6C025|nr:hypothetical protein [Streptomyces sp. L2]